MKRSYNFSHFCVIISFALIQSSAIYSQELNNPVDIVYDFGTEKYYVSNWADGNGYIVTLDLFGNPDSVFATDLEYAGGICIVDSILYVLKNEGLWGSNLASFLIGINIYSGQQVLIKQMPESGSYLDQVKPGNDNKLYISDSGLGNIYKYDITTYELTIIIDMSTNTRILGVCYDGINNRILFTQHINPNLSYIKTANPDGGEISILAFCEANLECIAMDSAGQYYISSWGNSSAYGDEVILRYNNVFTACEIIADSMDRPFGMYVDEADHLLYACNFGNDSISAIDLLITESEAHVHANKLIFYPNPVHDNLFLKTDENISVNVQIESLEGKALKSVDICSGQSIDLSGLPCGMYMLRYNTGTESFSLKIIKK
jgi:hypothetical protein